MSGRTKRTLAGRVAWLFWRLMRIVALLLLVSIIPAVALGRWFDETILSTLPADLGAVRAWRPPSTCRVYASNGDLFDEFYVERRVWVDLSELHATTWQAFVAAEDRRFFLHRGVDVPGIARAFWANYQAGSIQQGGSTITQQLVKNLLLGKERTYERKLKEAVLAWRLERELTKEQILELFLNFVFLGSGNYGVEAAALDYFGMSARTIDPGQAALLAGLVPAPSRYSPRRSPEVAAERRAIVLQAMVEEGYLSKNEAAAYVGDPVLLPAGERVTPATDASYATMVRREVRRLLPPGLAFEEGLEVHTALDTEVQAIAEEAVRQALFAVDERQGRRGAIERMARDDWDTWLQRAPGLDRDPETSAPRPPDLGDCFQALVRDHRDLGALAAGPFRYSLLPSDREHPVRTGDLETGPEPLSRQVADGDVLGVCLTAEGEVALNPRPWAEGAAVVLENQTGWVVALVGGYEVGIEGFVRATQARRQPGSSFKPYVYATALQRGYTQIDRVLDGPISLPAGNGRWWTPRNYTGGYAGWLPMRTALAQSLNTVSVRLTLEVGAASVARTARAMGVASPLRSDPTIGLGSSEVTPMDQALGYSTIARLGVPTEPVFIESLVDFEGREIAVAGGPIAVDGNTVGRLPGGPRPRALPAGVAYELADMMREVVRAGTARRAWKPGFDRAGKTGTTNGFADAWFVGFTPRYTVAVWVGSDSPQALGDKETGGRTALPAWIRIVEALPHEEGERLPIPDDAILARYGDLWIGIPRGEVSDRLLRGPRIEDEEPLVGFSWEKGGG